VPKWQQAVSIPAEETSLLIRMSTKTVQIDGLGSVLISKRKGQRSIRATIHGTTIKVTQPAWLPFSAGETFIRSRISWAKEHIVPLKNHEHGKKVGKQHILIYLRGSKLASRVGNEYIRITLPTHLNEGDPEVTSLVGKAIKKALRDEAETYLPKRTKYLADLHGFTYTSVTIKQLKRRWGSCTSKKDITFNLYLMNLAETYIDYVILHELCHTKEMNHGDKFWQLMEHVYPGAQKTARVVRRLSMEH
jgi:predicted metal-dependent hydrolase